MSSDYTGFGYLVGDAVVAPDKADEVDKAIAEAAASCATSRSTRTLSSARSQPGAREGADRTFVDNGYWLAALQARSREPDRLDRIRKRIGVLKSITPADIQKLAQNYLQPAGCSRRVIAEKQDRGQPHRPLWLNCGGAAARL